MLHYAPSMVSLGLVVLITSGAFANPTRQGLSMSLSRRSGRFNSSEEWAVWAKAHRDRLITKYGGTVSNAKRGTGTNLLVNQGLDSIFYGSVAVGTPLVSYNVILDTGSADLWLADSSCSVGCDGGIPTFDSSASSTFKDQRTPFQIQYGSGAAIGTLATDTVEMAGFAFTQVFAVCDQVDNVLNAPVSGLMGLGFSSLASSQATPFWENLVRNGAWDQPVMAFQLTRYIDDERARELEPGGVFTMGFTNTSLYTGQIDFNPIPDNIPGFWTQTISSLTVQGNQITLSSADLRAAIDTGTTLVGGPADAIAEIYAQIPGSQPAAGQAEGYYMFPCKTTVTVTLAFGGKTWSISPTDFNHQEIEEGFCMGAFFALPTGASLPSWIVGDTFLKNVYSVFQYNPPAVGFAQLSDFALSFNENNDIAVPTPTIGLSPTHISSSARAKSVPITLLFTLISLLGPLLYIL
ncbi:aspartic peptidase A1 [Mycena floridula]|nr:aspartic peptidase A1 [Mycena floridula]